MYIKFFEDSVRYIYFYLGYIHHHNRTQITFKFASKNVTTSMLFAIRVNILATSQTANEIGTFIPNNVRAAANNL